MLELVASYPALDEALEPTVCEDAVAEADMFEDARLEGEVPYAIPGQWTLAYIWPCGTWQRAKVEEGISPSHVDVDDPEDVVLSVSGGGWFPYGGSEFLARGSIF